MEEGVISEVIGRVSNWYSRYNRSPSCCNGCWPANTREDNTRLDQLAVDGVAVAWRLALGFVTTALECNTRYNIIWLESGYSIQRPGVIY